MKGLNISRQSWAIWSAHSYQTMCKSSGQKLCLPNSKHEEDLTPWLEMVGDFAKGSVPNTGLLDLLVCIVCKDYRVQVMVPQVSMSKLIKKYEEIPSLWITK